MYTGKVRVKRIFENYGYGISIGDEIEIKEGCFGLSQMIAGCISTWKKYKGIESFEQLQQYFSCICEFEEVKDKEESYEFRCKSGAYITIHTGTNDPKKFEIDCNYDDEADFCEYLKDGESFWVDADRLDTMLTFSIEDAVKLKDYLTDMIKIAEASGYFEKKAKEEAEKAKNEKRIQELHEIMAKAQVEIDALQNGCVD